MTRELTVFRADRVVGSLTKTAPGRCGSPTTMGGSTTMRRRPFRSRCPAAGNRSAPRWASSPNAPSTAPAGSPRTRSPARQDGARRLRRACLRPPSAPAPDRPPRARPEGSPDLTPPGAGGPAPGPAHRSSESRRIVPPRCVPRRGIRRRLRRGAPAAPPRGKPVREGEGRPAPGSIPACAGETRHPAGPRESHRPPSGSS